MDDLTLELLNSGIGCSVLDLLINHVFYADDLTLMSPTLMGLQLLMNICAKYAEKHNIIFNVTKSKGIIFYANSCKYKKPINVHLNGNIIKWHEKVEHLGHDVNNKLNDNDDIRSKCVDFICKANYILSVFRYANRSRARLTESENREKRFLTCHI